MSHLKTLYDENMRILVQRTTWENKIDDNIFWTRDKINSRYSSRDMKLFIHICTCIPLLFRPPKMFRFWAFVFATKFIFPGPVVCPAVTHLIVHYFYIISLFLFQESFFCPHSLLYPLRLILMILMILIFIEELSLRLFTFCS